MKRIEFVERLRRISLSYASLLEYAKEPKIAPPANVIRERLEKLDERFAQLAEELAEARRVPGFDEKT